MPDRIRLDHDGPIAVITLDRPDKLNALDASMLDGLDAAAASIERDPDVRAVLITGAGERAFCVGADIHAWAALDPLDMGRRWIEGGHRVFDRLARLRPPVVAVLNGYTFGGGLELALTADLRLAAETAELALPEVGIGTLPGWGGTSRLAALVGPARAKEMIFTGARIGAARAEAWGLVNAVHPPDALMDEALELARTIAANAPLAVQLAKQAIDAASAGPTNRAYEALAGTFAASTADGREGVASFRERRAPNFTGT